MTIEPEYAIWKEARDVYIKYFPTVKRRLGLAAIAGTVEVSSVYAFPEAPPVIKYTGEVLAATSVVLAYSGAIKWVLDRDKSYLEHNP